MWTPICEKIMSTYTTTTTNNLRKFSDDFDKQWPKNIPKYSEYGIHLLKQCVAANVKQPKPLKLKVIINNSEYFPFMWPTETCRIKRQPSERHEIIEKQAASAYPIIHERTLWLYTRFLEHKSKYGDDTSPELFANLSITNLIDRLLTKRCVTFIGREDYHLLFSGDLGYNCYDENQIYDKNDPKHINNLIGYDEVKLSALLSISSHSEFINNGGRRTDEGVIIGIIGARLERTGQMEYQDIIITGKQNTLENGYGLKATNYMEFTTRKLYDYRTLWDTFYDNENSTLYSNCTIDEKRYDHAFDPNAIFDNDMMKKRYAITFDTLLLDSDARAKASNKLAYIHVVGVGLGVWRAAAHQESIFLHTFEQRLKSLLPRLKNIRYINFSWFELPEYGELKNGNVIRSSETDNEHGIKIFLSRRNPADKLIGDEFKNTLLIVSYAWDGNALAGNDFWSGNLGSTGCAAAATSTLITEIHNPHINKPMISGHNLHIASAEFGVCHISEYIKKYLEQNKIF